MGFPADVRAGAKTVLDAVKTANPTALVQTYTSRPATIGSMPCAWVDEERWEFNHDSGLRQWAGEVDVWLVDEGLDNHETQGRLDSLLSLVLDQFSDTPHFATANTVGEPRRSRSGAYEVNGVVYPVVVVTIGRIFKQEGR